MTKDIDVNVVATAVIVELAKSFAKDLCSFVSQKAVNVKHMAEIELGSAYEAYLKYTSTRYSKAKTLLYRYEPKDIYSFYECIGLEHGKKTDDDTSDDLNEVKHVQRETKPDVDTSNVRNVTKLGHRIVITGSGGIGKSMMMRHFFLNSIKCKEYVPILVELRGLESRMNKDGTLADFIFMELVKFNFLLDRQYFDFSLEIGRYIILFDGYDEIRSNLSAKISGEIIDLCNKYPDNYFIVTSRPLDEFVGWSQFLELNAKSLTKPQAMSLINKLDFEPIIKYNFYTDLDNYLFNKYSSFASNPLLLNIMLITYDKRGSIPDNLNDFYEQAFSALFHTHDATKGAYKRYIRCKLGYEEFRSVFSYFCFKSFFKSQYEFTENQILDYINFAILKLKIEKYFLAEDYLFDLTNSVCMVVHEGLNYRFAHRSFQEYFSALYVAQLEDTTQKKLLTSWIKEGEYLRTPSFLEGLYNLQSKRFVANIIIPGLTELRENYINNGRSKYWFCENTYDIIRLTSNNEDNSNLKLIIINEYNKYLVEAVDKIRKQQSRINVKSYGRHNDDNSYTKEYDEQSLEKYYEEYGEEYDEEYDKESVGVIDIYNSEPYKNTPGTISFDSMRECGNLEKMIDANPWLTNDFQKALDFLEEYESSNSIKKRKYESILEEL